jgi:hypothetical protein
MSQTVTEHEWLHGPPRRVVVKVRRLKDERKRLLFLCAFFARYRAQLQRPTLPAAIDLVERFADGEAGDAHFSRAKGLARACDWSQERLPDNLSLDLLQVAHAVASDAAASVEVRMPMLKNGVLQADLLRDIFGNPFRPVAADPGWRTSTVVALAGQMYESRDFSPMPILGDALQDAGCENPDVLDHCRGDGPHVRGCWVVDLILGKS